MIIVTKCMIFYLFKLSYFCRDCSKLIDNTLIIQELQLQQYDRIDNNLSDKENLSFHTLLNNLKEFAILQTPKDVFNQVI
jgi:hypothetical protein